MPRSIDAHTACRLEAARRLLSVVGRDAADEQIVLVRVLVPRTHGFDAAGFDADRAEFDQLVAVLQILHHFLPSQNRDRMSRKREVMAR